MAAMNANSATRATTVNTIARVTFNDWRTNNSPARNKITAICSSSGSNEMMLGSCHVLIPSFRKDKSWTALRTGISGGRYS